MLKRKSAKIKAQMVLELLRGKPIEEVSRENQVTVMDDFVKKILLHES